MTVDSSENCGPTGVVVPAFNAARHLGEVLKKTTSMFSPGRVIVVDDGSTDATAAVAGGIGVHLIQHDRNRGKGAALHTGIEAARRLGMAYVITLDADGQHDPAEIPAFIACQARTGADIVVGNRMAARGTMPAIRVFANRVTSAFVSLRAGRPVPDSQNGFRLLRTSLFENIHLETARYDTESEILIKAGRLGARIESVPVRTIYGEEESAVDPLVDTLRFFRLVLRSLFW